MLKEAHGVEQCADATGAQAPRLQADEARTCDQDSDRYPWTPLHSCKRDTCAPIAQPSRRSKLIFRVIALVYSMSLHRQAIDKQKFALMNMHGFTSVPFKTESEHGFSKVNGVAKFSSAGIVLEFESKLLGFIGGGVKEVRVPKDEILDLKFRKGLFKVGAKIEIRMKTLGRLAELPHKDGKLTLKLERHDFDRGQAAFEQLRKDIEEHEASLPPARTPVSDLFTEEPEEETKSLK
jgi:hypothetical protein